MSAASNFYGSFSLCSIRGTPLELWYRVDPWIRDADIRANYGEYDLTLSVIGLTLSQVLAVGYVCWRLRIRSTEDRGYGRLAALLLRLSAVSYMLFLSLPAIGDRSRTMTGFGCFFHWFDCFFTTKWFRAEPTEIVRFLGLLPAFSAPALLLAARAFKVSLRRGVSKALTAIIAFSAGMLLLNMWMGATWSSIEKWSVFTWGSFFLGVAHGSGGLYLATLIAERKRMTLRWKEAVESAA